MKYPTSPQLTRRQFLGAAASVGVLSGIGRTLPQFGRFAPSFFNCNARFLNNLAAILAEKPALRVTLFLTVDEVAHWRGNSRQVEIGYRPSQANVAQDYTTWRRHYAKPMLASAEQGALWPKLATLCARKGILLASWDGFVNDGETPLLNGDSADLDAIFSVVNRSDFLTSYLTRLITPLHAPH